MGDRGRVLVVDDEEAMRLLMTRVLQHAGFEVQVVDNGLEALKAVDASPPDVVVSDIMMPELDGVDFVQGLRNFEGTRGLPIIFVTASENPQHLTSSIKLKALKYLSKPFSNDKLVATVKRAIAAVKKG